MHFDGDATVLKSNSSQVSRQVNLKQNASVNFGVVEPPVTVVRSKLENNSGRKQGIKLMHSNKCLKEILLSCRWNCTWVNSV